MEDTDRILADLRELVVRESPSDNADLVTSAAEWVRERLNRGALSIARTVPCPPRGHAVVASVGSEAEGRPSTLLLGHLDTVWPAGTLGEIPFSNDGTVVRGPGVFDMKAGAAVALSVLDRLRARSSSPRVTLLLVPDEEIGSSASSGLLIDLARKHDRVLVLEPSAAGGAAKVARKGTGLFRVRFTGVSSHAGLDPEKGASALQALAEFVLDAPKFASVEAGTTVTPTLASAGTRSNVVPENAEVTLDGRVWAPSEPERVERELRAWRPKDPRVRVDVEGGFDRPPLAESDASRALFASAQRIARDLGFELRGERVGGASDGNLTAAAGVPTLDGLGPMGDGAHARHEHVLVADLARRVDLIERLVLG
ncbi:MAG TPA: M20 family metallopeptidase [Vicinamibacteria bacterium]|nr:M20 family metallopeptidase [Vicinamibacteria bacterium]HRB13376.1 M20 family metallopeptidase [Vicinamibacteria bacterium]